MKNLLLAAVCLISMNISAQKLSGSEIPALTKAAFAKAHPGQIPAWEKEDGNYEAVYKEGGKEASCVITAKGKIMETETTVLIADLPLAARNYIKEHFKGVEAEEISRIDKSTGQVNFEFVARGRNILFDNDGKVLKSTKDRKD